MEPYPVPGPAGRTTALPLRLRIPPLSLNSAWKSEERRAALSEQWSSGRLPPPAGTRRFFKAELQRGCVRSGRAALWLCCLFCVHSHLSHVSSAHLPTGAHPGVQTRCSLCSCSIDVAAAVLQRQHFLRYQLCTHGAFVGGSETGTLISHPTEICQNHIKRKTAKCCEVKNKDRNKLPVTPHTRQV